MYITINRELIKFSKLLRCSISALPQERLKDVFSFQCLREQHVARELIRPGLKGASVQFTTTITFRSKAEDTPIPNVHIQLRYCIYIHSCLWCRGGWSGETTRNYSRTRIKWHRFMRHLVHNAIYSFGGTN
jgi:hypothetical protein